MIIGIPKEVKIDENRVSLPPAAVGQLVLHGHTVFVESHAGSGSAFSDAEYIKAGARMLESAADVWNKSEMVVKVKEPQPGEYPGMREGLILFTYLHLAAAKDLTHAMIESGVTGVAYETVTDPHGKLPLLEPMSEVAGRMAVQVAAHYLEKKQGGRGMLLGGVPGVPGVTGVPGVPGAPALPPSESPPPPPQATRSIRIRPRPAKRWGVLSMNPC